MCGIRPCAFAFLLLLLAFTVVTPALSDTALECSTDVQIVLGSDHCTNVFRRVVRSDEAVSIDKHTAGACWFRLRALLDETSAVEQTMPCATSLTVVKRKDKAEGRSTVTKRSYDCVLDTAVARTRTGTTTKSFVIDCEEEFQLHPNQRRMLAGFAAATMLLIGLCALVKKCLRQKRQRDRQPAETVEFRPAMRAALAKACGLDTHHQYAKLEAV